MKKLLLVFIIVCSLMFPNKIYADSSGTCGDELTWELSGSTLTISGSGKMYNYSESKPSPWNGSISSINKVVIESGVTSIGEYAFFHGRNISKIIMPDTVTSLGAYALSHCDSLKTAGPIGGNYNYEYGWTSSIPSFAFSGLYNLNKLVFVDSITSLGVQTASWCTSLKSITLPNNLVNISGNAFGHCTSLKSVYIPRTVTSIGSIAFSNCASGFSATLGCGSPLSKDVLNSAGITKYSYEAHTLQLVECVESTCSKYGTIEHYKCSQCGNRFLDNKGEKQASEKDLQMQKKPHELKYVEQIDATCTETGTIEHWVCKKCEAYFLDEDQKSEISKKSLIIEKIPHELIHKEKVDSTCKEEGTKEHWYCKKCEGIFSDKNGKYKTDLKSLTISKKPHTLAFIERKEPTCEEDGNIEHWKCDVCGKYFEDSKAKKELTKEKITITKIGHDYKETIKEPTCEEKGLITYVCQNNSEHTYTKEIEPLGHQLTHHNKKLPTFKSEGNKEYWQCEKCNKLFSDQNCENETTIEETKINKISIAIVALLSLLLISLIYFVIIFIKRKKKEK